MTYGEYKKKKQGGYDLSTQEETNELTTYQTYRKKKDSQSKSIFDDIKPNEDNLHERQRAARSARRAGTKESGSLPSNAQINPYFSQYDSPAAAAGAQIGNWASKLIQGDPNDGRTWFQKGAFEDGYQRGDVFKSILGTKTDAQINLGAGALGLGEKAIDTAAAIAPYNLATEIQGNYSDPGAQAGATIGQMLASLFMGKDANYVQDQRNELAAKALAEAKPAAEEFIKKDLYDEKKVAEWIVNNATIDGKINKLVGVDVERDSVLGEKTDALVQSAGQLAAQYGLQLVGVPWFITSSVSSFGSETESALRQGATLEEAVFSGTITAGAEILTEKLFGGDLFVNSAGFDGVVKELTEGITNKFIRKATQLGLNAVGEGSEEWLSQRIGQFGQWLAYTHDEKSLLQTLYSEEALNEAMEAFLGGVALGGGMGAINAVNTQERQGDSKADRNAHTESGQDAQETAAEVKPGTVEWVQELNDLGVGKQTTVDTENQVEYDNEEIILDALDGVPKRTVGIKYNNGNAIQLTKKEYAEVTSRISTNYHNANTSHEGIQFVDRSTDGENAKMYMYLYKDHGFGSYEIIGRLDYSRQGELIEQVREVIQNERVAEGTADGVSTLRNINERIDLGWRGDNDKGSGIGDDQATFSRNGQRQEDNGWSGRTNHDGYDDRGAGLRYDSKSPQNSNATRSANPSVGAANAGFDPNTHLQYQYGTLPSGENPVRSDDLPVSTDGTNRVSQTAVTVKGAKSTPDGLVDLLDKDVTTENGMTYIPITNDATVQKAYDRIVEEGWEAAKAQWHADVQSGKAGADLSATGALLLNNAANAGDKTAWLDILHDYQRLGTNTAQGLQALRILKKLAPSDKLYMAKRSVKQMVKDMKLDTEVTIDPALETEYNNAETDKQRDAVLKKIQKNVAQQLPTTFMEKFTALRYVNMLGNLRTQGRNIVGNLTMKATRSIHNTVATSIEAIANKVSGGKIGRTRSLTVNKDQKVAGAKDFDDLQSMILDGGKYSDNMTATGFARGVQEQKQIFKFKPLEGYRKVTNWMMETGDIIFAREAYARALAGYLKANGITETDLSKVDSKIMEDARLFAAKEAQEATFRDTNWLSGWVSKIGRRKDTPAVGKLISEGVMPFRKTPANVLVRAEEYSPLGVINSVVTSVKAAKKGSDVTANDVINSWAKTLTGTGIFGMGMLLQSLGLLSAGPDDDEDKNDFEDLNGWQDYALTLPDGTNLTIDCFSPTAIPLLMGAQLMKEIGDNGFELKDIESSLTSIADPLVEMSMLQGVNDSLENIQYADSNLGQFFINASLSYLTQGLTNTLFGQLERSFENSRMQTYVDRNSDLPAWLQRTLGKASAKTPVWDYNQIPYINAWGEEEENPGTALNLVYNLLSPSYFDKGKDDDLTRELNRLNDAQGERNVYPSIPDKSVTINKQEYNLSADEYVALAKKQGQSQRQLVENIIANSDYSILSDEDKAKAIGYAYEYARDSARGEVIEEHPGITTKWMTEIKGDVADAIIRHVATGTTDKYTSLSVSDASYVVDLLKGLLPEGGSNNVRTIQKVEAVAKADNKLSEAEQKKVLEDVLDDNAYAKYLKILALGQDTDDYAESYRIYLDTEGKGKKTRIINQYQKDLGVSQDVAEKIYNIYAGKS